MARYVKQAHGGTLRILEKGESGNPKGKPKKAETILRNAGYTKEDIRNIFQRVLELNEDECHEILNRPVASMLEKTLAQSVINSKKKGELRSVETILDRGFGKVKEQIEVTQTGLSTEDFIAMRKVTNDPVEISRAYQEIMK